MTQVKVQFTSQEAKELYNGELKYATERSSGFDLRAVGFDFRKEKRLAVESYLCFNKSGQCCGQETEDGFLLYQTKSILIKTGIKVSFDNNYELQIRPRSGLALKHGISIVNTPGTIDSDYTGEIGVILINHGSEAFEIKLGDRIAQGIICPVVKGQFEYVESLESTQRGDGGFGSSGVK